MTQPIDAINFLQYGQSAEFESSVQDMLMNRVRDRIDNERFAVAQTMFDNSDIDSDYDDAEELEVDSDEEI